MSYVAAFIIALSTMTTPQIAAYRNDCIARQLDRTAVQCSGEALFAAQAELRKIRRKGPAE